MTTHSFLAFLLAVGLLTITPGVDTAMVLHTAAVDGARRAAAVAVGVALGCLVWGLAVSVGLGAILAASTVAFLVVRWAGAAYLVYLGAMLLAKPRSSMDAGHGSARPTTEPDAFRQGFLTNLLNPKVGVFYITFLPQFISSEADVTLVTFLLACVHVAMALVWFAALIAAVVPLGAILRRAPVMRLMDRVTGCVFIAFGVRLAAR